MGRKGALVLLAVAIFWIATPAIACLQPTANHACCHNMAGGMNGCSPSPTLTNHACCQVSVPDAAILPGLAAASDPVSHAALSAPIPSPTAPALTALSSALVRAASPPDPSPGAASILRI